MAAAAYDIGRAEHDEITGLSRFACGFFIDREFGDAYPLHPKPPSHARAFIVMRQHFYVSVSRSFGQPRDRCANAIAARDDALHQIIERLSRKTGTVDHGASMLRRCPS